MKCMFCRIGETCFGHQTVTFEQGDLVIVIRAVPAQICEACGEPYFDQATTKRLEQLAEDSAHEASSNVLVREFCAA